MALARHGAIAVLTGGAATGGGAAGWLLRRLDQAAARAGPDSGFEDNVRACLDRVRPLVDSATELASDAARAEWTPEQLRLTCALAAGTFFAGVCVGVVVASASPMRAPARRHARVDRDTLEDEEEDLVPLPW